MSQLYNNDQLTSYVDQIFKRLERIEKQLLRVSEEVGVPMEDPRAGIPPEVIELVQAGDRLGAIKKHRELTGSSMEDAQAAVEAI